MDIKLLFPFENKINAPAYLKSIYHFFPAPKTIKPRLQECLTKIQDPKMHPIEKASRIWYEVVRLHISHEANKRTGKAIGSAILLSYGYLPPILSKDNFGKYVANLEKNFERKDGAERFTQFIAKEIIKIQKIGKDLRKCEKIT